MVPRDIADFEQTDQELYVQESLYRGNEEPVHQGERPIYPCRAGTPKRSRYKKGAKHVTQDGKHRRRVRKISW